MLRPGAKQDVQVASTPLLEQGLGRGHSRAGERGCGLGDFRPEVEVFLEARGHVVAEGLASWAQGAQMPSLRASHPGSRKIGQTAGHPPSQTKQFSQFTPGLASPDVNPAGGAGLWWATEGFCPAWRKDFRMPCDQVNRRPLAHV